MEQLKKIYIDFKHESLGTEHLLVKFNQKLEKAMKFYCNNIIKKPLDGIRFFYKDNELTGSDSAESAGLVNFCTINVHIENLPSK